MCGLSDRPGYYEGYMRGLRRFYHGPHFGTLQEHEEWLGLFYERDETRPTGAGVIKTGCRAEAPYVD